MKVSDHLQERSMTVHERLRQFLSEEDLKTLRTGHETVKKHSCKQSGT
jgi:hypothetical protein